MSITMDTLAAFYGSMLEVGVNFVSIIHS